MTWEQIRRAESHNFHFDEGGNVNVYQRALDIINEQGWYQDPQHSLAGGIGPNGEICLMRALQRACDEEHIVEGARWEQITAPLFEELGLPMTESLVRWNDDPHTSEEDVRLLLKRVSYKDSSTNG
jgi:hypothetical protein